MVASGKELITGPQLEAVHVTVVSGHKLEVNYRVIVQHRGSSLTLTAPGPFVRR